MNKKIFQYYIPSFTLVQFDQLWINVEAIYFWKKNYKLLLSPLSSLSFNCICVDTRWQQYSTHLHTNRTQNTEDGIHITITRGKKLKENKITRKAFLNFTPVSLSNNFSHSWIKTL
jgi:hypothetical protein